MTARWLRFRLQDQSGAGQGVQRPRIRCPQCDYEPTSTDRWMCDQQCRHVWNTFDTRGKCPACGFQWKDTACPRCQQWSAHDDWYTDHSP